MANCDKCGAKPITLLRYSGARLCSRHFCDFVVKRVKRELRRQLELKPAERIAVAVSGGKDSTVALHLVHGILGSRRGLQMCAVTVDEGISGYRGSGIPIVAKQCRDLGVEHIVVSFKEMFGTTMDDIAGMDRQMAACSYCGVFRRAAMNRAARDWKATRLATGLNLDDTAQSILMNFARGDIERLARLGPHRKVQTGLVPRIQPLRTIPENETTLYALVKGLKFHKLECPYAPEALRNSYRLVLAELEDQYPGTRHSILRSYDCMLPSLVKMYPPASLQRCKCGEPSLSARCKSCELLASLGIEEPT